MDKTTLDFTVLPPIEFLKDVEEKAKQAQHRFFAQAMEVEPEKLSGRLFSSMIEAAGRGVDTRLNVDYYSYLLTEGVFNYLPAFGKLSERRRESKKQKEETFKKLEESGGKVTAINPPQDLADHLFPVRNRNHMKIVVIDDIAWIGGINFRDMYFHIQDFMVRIPDQEIAKTLIDIFLSVESKTLIKNSYQTFQNGDELFIDSGTEDTSIIMDEAIKMVTSASKKILLATAFVPGGAFLKALTRRWREGIELSIITPSIKTVGGIFKLVNGYHKAEIMLKNRAFPITYSNANIHAKLLITDDTTALFGSHNYSHEGVKLKTAELAMKTQENNLVSQLIQFYNQLHPKK